MTISRPSRVLVVDDDRAFRLSTRALLKADGYDVERAENGREAAETLRRSAFDLVLLDVRMPGLDGLQLVEALRLWGHTTPILMISGHGTVDLAVKALHLGADDFLTKPVEPSVLSARVAALLERRPVPGSDDDNPAGLVGRSDVMASIVQRIRQVAPTETTVLIQGETGVGKELVARAVHQLSERAANRMIAINCGALAEGLLESELFGHARGAFTGAVRDRQGVFEAAERSTLFLDEVGEMSPNLQQRLLRALQEREVTPVGANRAIPVNVRVVAATSRDLRGMVADGSFREDLYYRIAVYPIDVPPLRERLDDIPLLVEAALARLRSRVPTWKDVSCTPFALRALRACDWPGNVRHLMGAIESAAVSAGGGRIEVQHLPAEIREGMEGTRLPRYRAPQDESDERERIQQALRKAGGSLTRTAELLGMSRTTLWRKVRALEIDPDAAVRKAVLEFPLPERG